MSRRILYFRFKTITEIKTTNHAIYIFQTKIIMCMLYCVLVYWCAGVAGMASVASNSGQRLDWHGDGRAGGSGKTHSADK